MKKLWLVSETFELETLKEAGQDVYYYHQVGEVPGPLLQDCEIVVISQGHHAKQRALELKTRGISDTRLSYIDIKAGENLFDRLNTPKHLLWDDVVTLEELPAENEVNVYPSGFGYLDKNFGWGWKVPELTVMAGAYGSGKSTVLQMLAAGWANGAGRKLGGGAMLCSWEDAGAEVKRNMRAFGAAHNAPDMLKLVSFVRRGPDDERLVSWYMDLVRYHHERFGTRFFGLDPWNEMDHQKDARQVETDYIRDMMKEFRRLVDRLQIVMVIATHVPAKMIKGDGAIEPFRIAHAFGSVQFANKADRGICVVRTKKFEKKNGHAVIRLDKSKIERKMGRKGTVALRFDENRFSFEYDGYATEQVQDVWKD